MGFCLPEGISLLILLWSQATQCICFGDSLLICTLLPQNGFQNVVLKSSKIVKQSLAVLEIFFLLLNYLQGIHSGNTSRASVSLKTKQNCSAPITSLFSGGLFWFLYVLFCFFAFIILLSNLLSLAHLLSVLFQTCWYLWQIMQPEEWHYRLAVCNRSHMLLRWTAVVFINI